MPESSTVGSTSPSSRCRQALAGLFIGICLALAITAPDPVHWWLENILVVGVLAALFIWRNEVRLSPASAGMLFAFGVLHEIGAWYSYAHVPYEDWLLALTGTNLEQLLGTERNHYDRLVHLAFGLLLAVPLREACLQLGLARGRWSWNLPVVLIMAGAMAYEICEWIVAELFGGDLATAYLGMQGDVWDAQKDMALGVLGAMLAMILARNLAGAPEGERRPQADRHKLEEARAVRS